MVRKLLTTLCVAGTFGIASANEAVTADGFSIPSMPDKVSPMLETAAPDANAPLDITAYGTTAWSATVISPAAWMPYSDSLGYRFWTNGYIGSQAGDSYRFFNAPISIPTGARIYGYSAMYYDASATGHISLYMNKHVCPSTGAACVKSSLLPTGTGTTDAFDGGYQGGNYISFATPINWENYIDHGTDFSAVYTYLRVNFSEGGGDLRMGPAALWWKRQVSPAPATASFSDVPTSHQFFQYIEALVDSGITSGCGGGNYCPDSPVTRGQMAVFLSKALGLHYPDSPTSN